LASVAAAYSLGRLRPPGWEDDGIRLTVDPFFDKERTGRYFDGDPFDRGIVIVFVRLENTLGAGATSSYLLRKEDMKMAVGTTR